MPADARAVRGNLGGVAPDGLGEYDRVIEPGTDHVFRNAARPFRRLDEKTWSVPGFLYNSLQAKPSSWVATDIHPGSQRNACARAPRASSGVLFVCERCAAITCLSRLRSSAASISPEVRLSRWPRRLAMRAFSAAG